MPKSKVRSHLRRTTRVEVLERLAATCAGMTPTKPEAHDGRAAEGRPEGDNPDKTGPGRGACEGGVGVASAVPTGSTAGRKAIKSVVTK